MNTEIFKSERHFALFDIVVSHGQLLLRSQKNENNKSNIDIIFFDTNFIQTFRGFWGIRISKIEKEPNKIDYNTVKEYLSYKNSNLFELESNNEKYYIAASFVRVFENELEFSESSLNYNKKGQLKEIATSIGK